MFNPAFARFAEETLSSGNEEARYAMVRDLVRLNSMDTLPLLMKAVNDPSHRVHEEALKGIRAFPTEDILPKLEGFLRNREDKSLRNAAVEAFSRLGTEATAYLLPLLKDDDKEIRMYSAVILGKIRDSGAVEWLIDALKDPDENVKHAVVESLGKIGDERAVRPLIECLKEGFWIQYPAVIALGEIGAPAAIEHLLKLSDNEMLKDTVDEALRKIDSRIE